MTAIFYCEILIPIFKNQDFSVKCESISVAQLSNPTFRNLFLNYQHQLYWQSKSGFRVIVKLYLF